MSDWLALNPAPTPALIDPLPVPPTSAGERFELEWEAAQATGRSFAAERNYRIAFDRAAAAFRAQGVPVENPYLEGAPLLARTGALPRLDLRDDGRVTVTTGDAERQRRIEAWNQAALRLRDQNPDALDVFPTADELTARADQDAARAFRAARAADGMGGGLGALSGALAGTMADPVQIASLVVGAPWRTVTAGRGLFREAVRVGGIEAGIGAGTQAVIEASAAPYRARIGVEGDALESILLAGAGGAVLGGGLRGLVGAWQLRGARLEGTTAGVRAGDEATLAQAQLAEDAGNPAGPEGALAHRRAIDAAVADVAQGRPARSLSAAAVPTPRVPVLDLADADVAQRAREVRRALDQPPREGSFALGFGPLPDSVVTRVRDETGLDLTGLDHVAYSDELRHAWNRHGANGDDVRVRPLTETDLARAPEYFATADRYVHDGQNHLGLPVIRAEKTLADGTIAVIEEVRARRGRLAFKSMFFVRGNGGGPGSGGSAPRGGPPQPERPKPNPGSAGQELGPALARFQAYTPAGRAVLVEPQVVELDELVPSHLDDGALNPAYPHAEGVQPRDRGAGPSQDQIRAIAAGLIPERLAPNVEAGLGAPIVADDLVVESGNGRALALRRAYAQPELAQVADAYRAFLAAQGYDVAGMRRPVLISRRISALTPEQRRAFVAEANGRATLAQNVAERARGDAARLDGALELWRGGDVDSPENADFVRAFLGTLTAEERGALLTTRGQLSAEGAARVRAALLARAYGDEMGGLLERFLEGQTEGLRRVAGALTDASARWAMLRRAVAAGEVDAGMEVTADLVAALRTLDEARRQGMPVERLLAQSDLDRPPLTHIGRAFLASFHAAPNLAGGPAGRATIAGRLDGFVTEALKARPGLDLFGTPPVRAGELLDGARQRTAPELTAAEPDAPEPEALRRAQLLRAAEDRDAAALPPERLPDADVAEAQRILGGQDVAVPVAEEGGAAVTRGGRELLDEAEEDVAQAAAAGACLLGSSPT